MKTINSVDTKEFLNHQVANLNVFTVKIHQIHWYMRGHNFFTLHEKMDDLYSEFGEQMDEVAERLLAIGGSPFSTLKEFLENASVEEAPYTNTVIILATCINQNSCTIFCLDKCAIPLANIKKCKTCTIQCFFGNVRFTR